MMDEHEGRGLTEFLDDRLEYRRLFSEVWGTFLLVLVAAGAGVVGAQPYGGGLILPVKVIAPGVMVMAVIYFMGTVSGAHLNPAVTWAFALRGNFPWRRVPGYIVAQAIGAFLACLFLQWTIGGIRHGATVPAPGVSDWVAVAIEGVLTLGLISVILGTSSGARNIGNKCGDRNRRVHRNRRRVGCAGHGCVDESDALACARHRRRAAEHVLDIPGRTDDRRDHRGRVRVHPEGSGNCGRHGGGRGRARCSAALSAGISGSTRADLSVLRWLCIACPFTDTRLWVIVTVAGLRSTSDFRRP